MDNSMANKQKIIDAFHSHPNEKWISIHELASFTGIDQNQVSGILRSSRDFVQSTRWIKNGEPVYATKESFRSGTAFIDKVLGAFKNRID